MNVLLPYLIGAASTFVVQFLIQFYIVPRVQTRKHREERWVKDVLDLGELLTTSVEKLATESWEAQQEVRLLEDYSSVSEPDKAKVERQRFLRERKMAANRATRALKDLVNFRVNWIADRIIILGNDADEIVDFFQASYLYRLKLMEPGPYDYMYMAEDKFEAFWDSERKLRGDMTSKVKKLTYLSRPPRASWRRRLRAFRRKVADRFTKPRAPKPLHAPASRPPSSS